MCKVTNLTESLAHEAKELLVGSLLGAAVNNHVAKFRLLSWLDLQLQKLVHLIKTGTEMRNVKERIGQICSINLNKT